MVSRRSALPLYHQLKDFITERIEGGDWSPGRQLPTELELSSEFAVSRTTVRQALQLLENEGLVERFQGKGTFVGRPKIAHNLGSMATVGAWLDGSRNSIAELRVLATALVSAPAGVAAHLNLTPGEQVYELKRTVVVDGEPMMLLTCWFPAARFPELEAHLAPPRSVRQVLRDFYQVEAIRQHKEVEVTILDEAEAHVLGAHPGAPALLVSYYSRSQEDGTPVEYRKMLVRGDRCKYYVDLEAPELLV